MYYNLTKIYDAYSMKTNDIKRLRWACRRGMLELDLILLPFFEQYFNELESIDQANFIELLSCTDQELYHWLLGQALPLDSHLRSIVEKIRATHVI